MILLDGSSLTLDDLEHIAVGRPAIDLEPAARERVDVGRRALEAAMAGGATIYGVNTGFGDLASVRIPDDRLETLQERLILSHAAGLGAPLPERVVRVMLALRANTLARGHSGVRAAIIDRLLDLLREDVLPVVPSRGSVGASGDLAPLAHLALPLLGVGPVLVEGVERPAREVLAERGWEPLRLAAKEGLALINGTQAMTAVLALALRQSRELARAADLVGALTTDALRGTDTAFDARIHALRPHAGQRAAARNLWSLLQGSAIRESHRIEDVRVQDPYCVRCMPQVHGAARDVFESAARQVEIEINSVTDNPLVFVGADGRAEVLSGGNFHGEPMAIAADTVAIAVAELGAISERRIEKLTNAAFSGLPPFLVRDAGLNSGFMIAQVTAAALASENKTLAHPASVDTVPTSADKEDHVSMGMWAALKLTQVVDNVRRILAIEAVAAAQGIDLLRPLTSSPALERAHASIRRRVDPWDADRWMAPDLAAGEAWLAGEARELASELV
jgi:histidine ammonia-lyase